MNYWNIGRDAVLVGLPRRLVHNGHRLRGRAVRARDRTLELWDCLEERCLLAAPTNGLISENYAGTNSALIGALFPSISANGQYVAFESGSFEGDLTPAPSDLVNGLTVQNDAPNVYVRDLATNTTICISVSISYQTPTTGDDDSRYPIISADGNTVVFLSNANDLTANDNSTNNPNDNQNVFAWSRATNTVTLVTANYDGTAPANDPDTNEFGTAENISVSANGQYVAFDSQATNLVSNATNISGYTANVYVRDLVTGKTILVSASTAGAHSGGDGPSNEPVISADGSTVAFDSLANNLDPSYTDLEPFDNYQVYVSTLGPNDTLSATKLVSIDPTATTVGNDTSAFPSVSDNGQMVAFQSSATNLVSVPVQGGSIQDDYVRDLATNTTQLVSVDDAGTADGDSSSFAPQISGDGNHVLFYSLADNLTANVTNGNTNVFERNLTTNTTQLVSVNDTGTNGGDDTSTLANQTFVNASQTATGQISENGQYVIFISVATDLVPNFVQESGGSPFGKDVYLRDTVAGTTALVSHALGTTTTGGTGESGTAAIASNGSKIAFQSAFPDAPDNLVSNDTNGQTQLFDAVLSPAVATAIMATVGTPQSAKVNTEFATALEATVTNQNGNPLSGATVTFAAPTTGASGTFPGASTTVMVATNASGVATAPAFTANATTGSYTVTASVAGVATPASFSLTNTNTSGLVATAITAVSGAGTYSSNATLTATLTANGMPLAGKSIAFTLDINGDVTPVASAMTNTNGVATASGISLAGFHAVTDTAAVGAIFAGDATHAESGGSGNLTVNRATPSISWPAHPPIVYGTALGGNQLDATAGYNGASVGGNFAYSPASGTLLGAGAQTLSETFTPTDTTDYKSTTTTTTINVLPASLTVTVRSASRSYGQPNPTFLVSYSGFAPGQGPSVLSGVLTLTTTASLTSTVGSYPLMASGLSSPNYEISYVPSTLTVNSEALTFAAVNKVKKFKAANPHLTFIEAGLVLGESAKKVFTGAPVLSTTAAKKSPPGQYSIMVRMGKLRLLNNNYSFTFISGVLKVIG